MVIAHALTIGVVEIVNVDCMLCSSPEGKALSVQIWRIESEEVGNQYIRVVSYCSSKATFMIHVSDLWWQSL